MYRVYYDAIDHFCHGFMKYHPPRRPHIREHDYELYHGVVEAGYRFHDMMLGAMLDLAPEDVTVIICARAPAARRAGRRHPARALPPDRRVAGGLAPLAGGGSCVPARPC